MVGCESGAVDRDIEPCSLSQVIDTVSPRALSFTPTLSQRPEGTVASPATATAPQCTTCTVVQHGDGVHTPDFMVPFMEEAFEGMTLTPPPAPLLHRPPEPPTVTSPQYFGGDGVSWMGGLPREWGSLKEEMYIPTSFGLVHGQHCSLCGAVIDLKLHSTLCSIRCCTGKCVCLDSLVAKALLELPPAPVHSPVLRLPVWVVQSFLETWPSEPSDPNWLQHSHSVDKAFATRIRGLDALLLERSQLLTQKA